MKSLGVFLITVILSSSNAFSGEITGLKAKNLSDSLDNIADSITAGMGDCSSGKCFSNVLFVTCLGQFNDQSRVTTCTFHALSADAKKIPVAIVDNHLATALSNALADAGAFADASLGSTTVTAKSAGCRYDTHQTLVSYVCDLE